MEATLPQRIIPRIGLIALSLWVAAPAAAQPSADVIGQIKVVSGQVSIVRRGGVHVASLGSHVAVADVLKTGADGKVAVMLRDETRLALGPNSELELANFAFAPAEQQLGLSIRLVRGVLSYVSGLIAKLAPATVRLQTPTSIVGVRGTHVLIKVASP